MAERIAAEAGAPDIGRTMLISRGDRKRLRRLRDVIEHLDDRLLPPKNARHPRLAGDWIIAAPHEYGFELNGVCTTFAQLSGWIRQLHELGEWIIEQERITARDRLI